MQRQKQLYQPQLGGNTSLVVPVGNGLERLMVLPFRQTPPTLAFEDLRSKRQRSENDSHWLYMAHGLGIFE